MNGLGSTPRLWAADMAIGSSRMAVALLLNTCVLMLVSMITPPKTNIGPAPLNKLKNALA